MTEITGRELSESLAQYLGPNWMTWTNQPLGSVQHDNAPIADVLAVFKSYTNPCAKIYEVKVSRGDFLRDVGEGKYRKYLVCCNQLYFAAPQGLLNKTEMPEGCGLLTFGRNGWASVRTAQRRDFTMPQDLMMTLLMKGYQSHFQEYRRLEADRLREYGNLQEAASRFGLKLSRDIVLSRQCLSEATELKKKIETLAHKEFATIDWALDWLRREVDSLLGKHKYGREAGELVKIALQLFGGYGYLAERDLREIADRLKGQSGEPSV